jgi:predicted nucleic acid-binding protein
MKTLVDTSAWVDYLRRSKNATSAAVRQLIDVGEAATTDVVIMEVLAGSTDPDQITSWERALDYAELLEQVPREDAETAAHLYRACRRAGESPRQLTDCLIAAVALRNGVPVLHRDRDYDVIARHTGLEAVSE